MVGEREGRKGGDVGSGTLGYDLCGFMSGIGKIIRDMDRPDHTLDIPQATNESQAVKSRSIWRLAEIGLFWNWPLSWTKGRFDV